MIRGFGGALFSTYSQTLNGYVVEATLLDLHPSMYTLRGPFLVSRTGDEG